MKIWGMMMVVAGVALVGCSKSEKAPVALPPAAPDMKIEEPAAAVPAPEVKVEEAVPAPAPAAAKVEEAAPAPANQ